MKTYWQAEFTDFRGGTVRYNFKFPTRPECERFIATQPKPNIRAIEITPDPVQFIEPVSEPEPIDRDPGDESASVEGDDAPTISAAAAISSFVATLEQPGAVVVCAAAEVTKQRKCAALAKARAAKKAKREAAHAAA